MGIAVALVALVILIIVGIIAFSIFGSAFTDFQKQLADKQRIEDTQDEPEPEEVGGTPEETDVLCNLRIEFVGSAQGELLDDKVTLHHGSFQANTPENVLGFRGHDTAVAHYKWFCPEGVNEASLLDLMGFHAGANLQQANLQLAHIWTQQVDVDIFINFDGFSLTSGSQLTACEKGVGCDVSDKNLEFSGRDTILQGTEFPYAYSVPIYLYDVIEDDYRIDFWSEDFRMNDKPVNSKFKYTVCKAGNYDEAKKTCGNN